MTNEEKALSIKDDEKAEMIAYRLSHPLRCERCGELVWEAKDSADTAFKAAMKMAKWKDEEIKAEKQALINKACEWLRNNIESDKYLSPDEESYRMGCGVDYLETNMFIEDFKNYSCGLIERNGR